jgi:signal transduction histidine kinase
MSVNMQTKKMILEEVKAVKLFIWMFYIIFFTYELFYHFFPPLPSINEESTLKLGMGIWYYILLLGMIPIGVYLIRINKPHLVKYVIFYIYNILDFINVMLIYWGKTGKSSFGNVVDVFIVLFAIIFVNKHYVWIVSLGTILKYLLLGVILQEVHAFLPIGIFTFLFIFSLIILSRFLSYINSLTAAFEEVKKKEKLALLGQMATSIGHEIRNPLSALRGFTQLQQQRDKSENNYYPIMIQEIDRINSIVDDLMVLGRPKSPHFKLHDFTKIVEYVTEITRQHAENSGSKIVVEHYKEIPQIECDEKQMKQVLLNLLKNAIESMLNGGTIKIGMSMDGKNSIKVCIKDEGSGIEPEQLKRLGEPFYTTKQDGNGLGLMVTKKIIEEHQGDILFESEKGKGTKVTIVLPVKQKH